MKSRIVLWSAFATTLTWIGACGQDSSQTASGLKEAMNRHNNPRDVAGAPGELAFNYANLPTSAAVAGVWTGNWWPLNRGGVAGPLQKLDMVTNGRGLAYSWEMMSTRRNWGIPWAGHCNGLAAAGTMTRAPAHGVLYRGVNFSVDDVKGLLVEAWQGGGKIVGMRCFDRRPFTDRSGRMLTDRCRDLNPGAFHVAVSNFLGRFALPVIIDINADAQVWNYPVVNYNVEQSQELGVNEALGRLGLIQGIAYPYNREVARLRYVRTRVQLVTKVQKVYEYLLEEDANGAIIGGEWVGRSKIEHPDFVWRHTRPQVENPHVDINTVYEIYQLSLQ